MSSFKTFLTVVLLNAKISTWPMSLKKHWTQSHAHESLAVSSQNCIWEKCTPEYSERVPNYTIPKIIRKKEKTFVKQSKQKCRCLVQVYVEKLKWNLASFWPFKIVNFHSLMHYAKYEIIFLSTRTQTAKA